MTIYVSPANRATTCRYRARMIAEFERQAVTLPVPMLRRDDDIPPPTTPVVPALPVECR